MNGHAECTKRRYESEHAAKQAHSSAPYRVRTYLCPACHGWHVTNQEKRHVAPRPESTVSKSLRARERQRPRRTATPVAVPPGQQPMASLVERLAGKERDLQDVREALKLLKTRIREEAARQQSAADATNIHDDPDAPARKNCHEFAAHVLESLL